MTAPKPGLWTTASTAVEVTVVHVSGRRATGRVVSWTAPGECEVDTGTSRTTGVLLETWQRRQGGAS